MAAQEDTDRVENALKELVAASHAAGTGGWTTAGDLKEKLQDDKALKGRLWPHGLCNANVLDIAEGLGYTVCRQATGWKRPARFPKTINGAAVKEKFKSGIRPADQAASNAVAPTAAAAASAADGAGPMDVDGAPQAQVPHAAGGSSSTPQGTGGGSLAAVVLGTRTREEGDAK